jgi:RNA polymerase sigma factor (sigma-70 family)
MANEQDEFRDLMDRVAEGDQQAAAHLLHVYGDTVILVIRHRLKTCPRLRRACGSDDLSQNVWQALFACPARLRLLATPLDFVRYLTGMSRRQVDKEKRRHFGTQKRDMRRVRNMGDASVAAKAEIVADRRPNPAQQAASAEEWEEWLRTLTSQQQQLFLMLRAGFTHKEIATEFDCSERTIERLVAELRNQPPPTLLPYL